MGRKKRNRKNKQRKKFKEVVEIQKEVVELKEEVEVEEVEQLEEEVEEVEVEEVEQLEEEAEVEVELEEEAEIEVEQLEEEAEVEVEQLEEKTEQNIEDEVEQLEEEAEQLEEEVEQLEEAEQLEEEAEQLEEAEQNIEDEVDVEVQLEEEAEQNVEDEVDVEVQLEEEAEQNVEEEAEQNVEEEAEVEVEQLEDEVEHEIKKWEVIEPTLVNIFQSLKLMHIFCVVNEKEEPERYIKLKNMLKEYHLDEYYKCISPTWKNTITDENIKKYIKSTKYLAKYREKINLPPKRMSRAELSVILNHRAVLRHISKKYDSGYFLICESDVQFTQNFNMFPEILKQLNENEDKWDLMYVGKMPQSNFYKCTREIINTDAYQIYLGKEDKTADAMLWKYETIIKFLKYMKSDLDFKLPYDTYLQNFYRNDNIKFGWIQPHLMFQTTFHGLSKSKVQGDEEIEPRKPDFYF